MSFTSTVGRVVAGSAVAAALSIAGIGMVAAANAAPPVAADASGTAVTLTATADPLPENVIVGEAIPLDTLSGVPVTLTVTPPSK